MLPEDQGFLLDPGDVGREVPGFEVCAELPPGEADGGEGLVPIPGGPPGMEEVGGLRVVPGEGCGPVSPPELVVEDPCEGSGDWGASAVVLLEGLVVPAVSGGVGGPEGPGARDRLGLATALGKKPCPSPPGVPGRLTCGAGLLFRDLNLQDRGRCA